MQESVGYIIPCFNAGSTIVRAVNSVLNQSYKNTFVFLVDDCSTDDTTKILLKCYADNSRVKLIFLPENLGPSGARNSALKSVDTDWVALLDADDSLEIGRTEYLINEANARSSKIIVDTFFLVDPSTQKPYVHKYASLLRGDGVIRLDMARVIEHGLGVLKPIYRRELLDGAERLVYDQDVRIGEDLLFLCGLLSRCEHMYLTKYGGYLKTETPGSLTNTNALNTIETMLRVMEMLLSRFGEKLSVEVSVARRIVVLKDALAWALIKKNIFNIFNPVIIFRGIRHVALLRKRFSKTTIEGALSE